MRLTKALEYERVYDAKCKKVRGPLILFGAANGLAYPRLGLAIGRKVGSAVARNRVKRMVREAFRHLQHDFPRAKEGFYDIVVSARVHKAASKAEYIEWIQSGAEAIHKEYTKRSERTGAPAAPSASPEDGPRNV
jgi:ribonuclease P protein component